MGSFAGRFGGILYPYVNYLSKNKSVSFLPLVIFGVLSVAGGFMALPLPRPDIGRCPNHRRRRNYEEFCKRHEAKTARNGSAATAATATVGESLPMMDGKSAA